MRLLLVRHGETVANAKGINQGWLPGALNAKGKREAKTLAKHLAKQRIDIIYASDLERVQQTLAPLKKLRPDITVITTKKLREEHMGIYEGKRWGSITAAATALGVDRYHYKVPGGESLPGMQRRVRTFAKEVIRKYWGTDTVVCFYTHGGPAGAIAMQLTDTPERRFHYWSLENAHYHVFSIKTTGVRCLKRNAAS